MGVAARMNIMTKTELTPSKGKYLRCDLTFQTFNRLWVLNPTGIDKRGKMYWECLCECGNKTIVSASYLRNGKIKSCGCLRKEGNNTKHQHTSGSHTPSPTYNSWRKAKQRCNNPNNRDWHRYGGRGIKIDPRWDSFKNFLEDMGERPDGTTID